MANWNNWNSNSQVYPNMNFPMPYMYGPQAMMYSGVGPMQMYPNPRALVPPSQPNFGAVPSSTQNIQGQGPSSAPVPLQAAAAASNSVALPPNMNYSRPPVSGPPMSGPSSMSNMCPNPVYQPQYLPLNTATMVRPSGVPETSRGPPPLNPCTSMGARDNNSHVDGPSLQPIPKPNEPVIPLLGQYGIVGVKSRRPQQKRSEMKVLRESKDTIERQVQTIRYQNVVQAWKSGGDGPCPTYEEVEGLVKRDKEEARAGNTACFFCQKWFPIIRARDWHMRTCPKNPEWSVPVAEEEKGKAEDSLSMLKPTSMSDVNREIQQQKEQLEKIKEALKRQKTPSEDDMWGKEMEKPHFKCSFCNEDFAGFDAWDSHMQNCLANQDRNRNSDHGIGGIPGLSPMEEEESEVVDYSHGFTTLPKQNASRETWPSEIGSKYAPEPEKKSRYKELIPPPPNIDAEIGFRKFELSEELQMRGKARPMDVFDNRQRGAYECPNPPFSASHKKSADIGSLGRGKESWHLPTEIRSISMEQDGGFLSSEISRAAIPLLDGDIGRMKSAEILLQDCKSYASLGEAASSSRMESTVHRRRMKEWEASPISEDNDNETLNRFSRDVPSFEDIDFKNTDMIKHVVESLVGLNSGPVIRPVTPDPIPKISDTNLLKETIESLVGLDELPSSWSEMSKDGSIDPISKKSSRKHTELEDQWHRDKLGTITRQKSQVTSSPKLFHMKNQEEKGKFNEAENIARKQARHFPESQKSKRQYGLKNVEKYFPGSLGQKRKFKEIKNVERHCHEGSEEKRTFKEGRNVEDFPENEEEARMFKEVRRVEMRHRSSDNTYFPESLEERRKFKDGKNVERSDRKRNMDNMKLRQEREHQSHSRKTRSGSHSQRRQHSESTSLIGQNPSRSPGLRRHQSRSKSPAKWRKSRSRSPHRYSRSPDRKQRAMSPISHQRDHSKSPRPLQQHSHSENHRSSLRHHSPKQLHATEDVLKSDMKQPSDSAQSDIYQQSMSVAVVNPMMNVRPPFMSFPPPPIYRPLLPFMPQSVYSMMIPPMIPPPLHPSAPPPHFHSSVQAVSHPPPPGETMPESIPHYHGPDRNERGESKEYLNKIAEFLSQTRHPDRNSLERYPRHQRRSPRPRSPQWHWSHSPHSREYRQYPPPHDSDRVLRHSPEVSPSGRPAGHYASAGIHHKRRSRNPVRLKSDRHFSWEYHHTDEFRNSQTSPRESIESPLSLSSLSSIDGDIDYKVHPDSRKKVRKEHIPSSKQAHKSSEKEGTKRRKPPSSTAKRVAKSIILDIITAVVRSHVNCGNDQIVAGHLSDVSESDLPELSKQGETTKDTLSDISDTEDAVMNLSDVSTTEEHDESVMPPEELDQVSDAEAKVSDMDGTVEPPSGLEQVSDSENAAEQFSEISMDPDEFLVLSEISDDDDDDDDEKQVNPENDLDSTNTKKEEKESIVSKRKTLASPQPEEGIEGE